MWNWFSRVVLGSAGDAATDLRSDVALLDRPGRPPRWTGRGAINVHVFNTKAGFVEPFFNHVEGDTSCRKAA